MSIKKLCEALDPENNLISAEVMQKRIISRETKTYIWKDTSNIIITTQGNTLPAKLKIYGGLTQIKIRPHIATVKQCYKCYRYGHMKQYCRKQHQVCVVCGEFAHGHCEKAPYCINCGGNHKANNKGCNTYQYNKNIQEVSALRNIKYYETKKIVDNRQEPYENPWIRTGN